ncbi:2-succinyl-5-enolpyruvyl-6-hydroxy-3-cyclohexene-1-carboxylic-acid synthase [Allobacillus sp. GCM10007491]|uniref:2-succinyl-5-enolpyruvyl-6-hydroxy-3-cyclohexene-1-carboxylate synthase n=1 Tax=Allobacillus saliphilus TaxID=2912308 RepID=A0A941HT55_9BACI|nr:2-succinyl-5-enolpyruvyl-6-hydroxy-3-cyclohexene-1-carboxylic-acid synthase [Allobacillus saliphilus]MBR7553612.1 2-succinyl-5-enolpyruvyl-6-hydroxy-3-cyclohexene-1-carboxylic-acid synthase [Allobacillus saliphilus]
MNMGEASRYLTNFVDELAQNGMEHVVISPGSRSTPLALTFTEHPAIQEWVHFDERSSAFFALGMAKSKQKPVALVCTSGTAAANYYPAIVEAYYSRVPLIVLTADRPHELRDNGAPQAIDQIKMYGDYVKYFHEMAIPEAAPSLITYARRQAARAYSQAETTQPGAVQLNFPFRDPLIPDFTLENLWGNATGNYVTGITGHEQLHPSQTETLIHQLKDLSKGIIVCGELPGDTDVEAIHQLAEHWNVPIFADVLSHVRHGNKGNAQVISTYDAILKDEKIAHTLEPDFILRFGAMPVSKPYLKWIQAVPLKHHIVVDQASGYREPASLETTMVYSEPNELVQQLLNSSVQLKGDMAWLEMWTKMDEKAMQEIRGTVEGEQLTEGKVAFELTEAANTDDVIFVGNSMPIRDMDTFSLAKKEKIRIHGNRGANGIDGLISTATGFAATGNSVTLFLGDLSFLHDYTALFIARKYELNLRVVVVNNNGGGIFSFLPQNTEADHFETLFGTPFNPPIKTLAEAVGYRYHQPKTSEEFQQLVRQPISGMEIIEVVTDRDENKQHHRALWQRITESIQKEG